MPQPPKPLFPARSARDWLGAELRHWRNVRNLTQDRLGALVHVSGDLIAKVEKATRDCPPGLADALDSVLGTGGVLSRHLPLVVAEADRQRADADQHPADADNADSSDEGVARQPLVLRTLALPEQECPEGPCFTEGHSLCGPSTGAAVGEEVRVLCRTADGRITSVTMPRRALLRGGLTGAALLSVPSRSGVPAPATAWQGMSGAFLPDRNPVQHLHQLRRALVECDNILGPGHVIAIVSGHIRLIQRLREGASGADRGALLRAQAEYAEFCGWLHQDSGDHRSARYWTDRALDWSHATGDHELTAYVMVRKTQLAGDMRDAIEAVDLADAVRHLTAPRSRLEAMGIMYGAHGHALRGDTTACQRAYDAALDMVGDARDDSPRRRGGWLDVNYVKAQQAHSLSFLGDYPAAVDGFDQVLRTLPPTYRRDRGVYLARAAVAHARAGDPERAATTAARALPIAVETGSARILAEMASLDADLRRWHTVPEVVEFRESLE